MATVGESAYRQFVVKLQAKVSSRFMTGRDIQNIGNTFWKLLNNQFKEDAKAEQGRNAFWSFARYLKQCLVNNELDVLNDLWSKFDQNGKNLFENMYDNCLNELVSDVV